MTKFGFGITDGTAPLTQVIAKHIDYRQNKMFDAYFSDPTRFFTTVSRIDAFA
jgi:hypothetical protein